MVAPRSGRRILLYATFMALTGFLGSGFLQGAGAGEVHYAYDARGRLAAVTAEDGVTYGYHYDDAGNLTSIYKADVLVTDFTPSSADANTNVTIEGVGFDPDNLEVRFNGTLAQVVNATATEMQTRPNGPILGESGCIATPYTSPPISFTAGVWTFEADEQGPDRHCHQFSISLQ